MIATYNFEKRKYQPKNLQKKKILSN